MLQIDELLKQVIQRNASDLHISTGHSPTFRVHGTIEFADDFPPLSAAESKELLSGIMPKHNLEEFETSGDTDFAYSIDDIGRFRVNVFEDYNGTGASFRLIPHEILSVERLGLPKTIEQFCFLSQGMVIITGATGSGKSTSLASLIDLINRSRKEHIITIEDPIEFVHRSKQCLINHREVHTHTESFAKALRASLREDPDIVLVGEMRDPETIENAIRLAETGHLVFCTLHTNNSYNTIDRIINVFPAERQNHIRALLADTLKGVLSQTLCKKMDGTGRVVATELLVVTTAVSANIRDGKTYQIPSTIQTSQNMGMHLLESSLLELVLNGSITPEEAYYKAPNKSFMEKELNKRNIPLDLSVNVLADTPQQDENSHESEAREDQRTLIP